jgi:23S rRNA pseudouridine2605 synthase
MDYNNSNQEGNSGRRPRQRFHTSQSGNRYERATYNPSAGASSHAPRTDQAYAPRQERSYSAPSERPFAPRSEAAPRPRFNEGREGFVSRPRFDHTQESVFAQRPRRVERAPHARPANNNNGRPQQQQGEGGFSRRPAFNKQRQRTSSPNAKYSTKKRVEYEEKYEDPTKPIRLNKFLANAGICSRREADDFIQAGVVTVNGEVVSELGAKVLPTDVVKFHDQPVRREKKVYVLLNKPKNCVTTTDDPQERHKVTDLVRNACSERIYPVGRLDRNTTGVLLLTNDGDLAAKLTHPKFGKKKIYAATLDNDLTDEAYNEIMAGITLDDEVIVPDALAFPKEDDRKHIGIQIHSGQNRVVRRIFEKVGYKVVALDRVSFAGLTKKNVPRGKYRYLTQDEVNMLLMGAFE